MKEHLKSIIEAIKQACAETGMTLVTNDEILSDAIVVYINTKTFMAEAKDISQQPVGENQVLASEKQKAFAKQLGYKENMDNMTMKEASAKINELKNKGK